MDWIWKAILVVVSGTILLRIAGRKSISQMTLAQVVIMIGIGSLLVQPVADKNIWITMAVGGIFVLTLIIIEYAQLKFDFLESFITGKSKVVIEDGKIVEKSLRKLRLTVDQLEIQLRKNNISKISDVKTATLEANGQIGYILKENAQIATKGDLEKVLQNIEEIKQLINNKLPNVSVVPSFEQFNSKEASKNETIFTEVVNNAHDDLPPKEFQ